MPNRSLDEIMSAFGPVLEEFDEIARAAHARYRSYESEILLEHDARAQAACTYAHMSAEAARRFIGRSGIRDLEIRGLRLWLFEKENAVVRLKKMDEDGLVRNYPTEQAKDFDRGKELPGLPMPPVRLTAGYLLDATATKFIRTQVARPISRKRTLWCAAIIPAEERVQGDRVWKDVTRQSSFGP
jgi:hypothetical protein